MREKMRMKRKCELCSNSATVYCESDQASLCSQCDSKVHGANFLVAKHSRTLLCHVCQSQTSWTGSGAKLGPAISVCQTCLSARNREAERHTETMNVDHSGGDRGGGDEDGHDEDRDHDHDDDDDGDGDGDGGDGDDDVDDNDNLDDDEDEDDGDNQVVPWSYSVSHSR